MVVVLTRGWVWLTSMLCVVHPLVILFYARVREPTEKLGFPPR